MIFIWILGAAQPPMAVELALGGALRVGHLGGSVVAVWSCLLADYAVKASLLAGRFASGRWQHARV